MASLTLAVAGLTASHSSTDQNAARILRGMLVNKGYDVEGMSNQEQADAVVAETVEFYNECALATEVNEASSAARQAVVDAPPTFSEA